MQDSPDDLAMDSAAGVPNGPPTRDLGDARVATGRGQRRQVFVWGLLACFLFGLVSLASASFFLYAVWVIGGALVLAVAMSAVAASGVEIEREVEAEEVELGGALEASLVVHNAKPLPAPWLFVEDHVEPGLDVEGPRCLYKSLAGNEIQTLTYKLHSLRRGLFRIGPSVVEASGPFGLLRRFRVAGQARFVTVLPRPVAIGQGWPLGHRPVHEVPRRHSLFEDPSRFLGIRAYRPGDPLRRIHWRATARSNELQTKLYEPAVLEGMLIAVEMSQEVWGEAGAAADATLELAVVTAASLADFVLRGNQRAGLLANGTDAAERYRDEWAGETFRRLEDALEEAEGRRKLTGYRPLEVEAAKGAHQRSRLLTALARLVPAPGPTLPKVLDIELPRLPRSLVLLLVTPRVDGELVSVAASLKRSGIDVGVVQVGRRGGASAGSALPTGIPLHLVSSQADLERLGGAQL